MENQLKLCCYDGYDMGQYYDSLENPLALKTPKSQKYWIFGTKKYSVF